MTAAQWLGIAVAMNAFSIVVLWRRATRAERVVEAQAEHIHEMAAERLELGDRCPYCGPHASDPVPPPMTVPR